MIGRSLSGVVGGDLGNGVVERGLGDGVVRGGLDGGVNEVNSSVDKKCVQVFWLKKWWCRYLSLQSLFEFGNIII